MLRNDSTQRSNKLNTVLNEVLSLNAQEFYRLRARRFPSRVLNEVLSLNAQELPNYILHAIDRQILNEVLSLNAQEYLSWTCK